MADPRSDPRPDPAATLPLSLATRLASTADMRHMDAHAIETLGLPARLLMENAAQAVAAVVQSRLAECALRGPVVVCCGTGNNGGDGYAVARLLANAGVDTRVIALGALQGGDAAANALAWERFGAVLPWSGTPEKARHTLTQAAVLVDALFGTGLTREITGAAAELVTAFNAAPAPFKVAVDLPSGVSGDTGAVLGVAARCTDTVTFQVGKLGAYLHPGAGYAGRIHVAPISIAEHWTPSAPRNYLLTEAFAAALLPHRPADGHKGTFGHLLALCGSAGMGGAALLAGRGALRTGAGLITLGVPRTLRDAFVCQTPELMTLSAPEGDGETLDDAQAPFFLKEAATRNAVALGCGLGRTPGTAAFVRKVTGAMTQPLVLDADGLFALSQESLRTRPGPTIITPHPGELARLAGITREDIAADRLGTARRLAEAWNVVLVLKGAGTVIATPDGPAFINPTGDHGLATGGTGDVLTGILGSLLAQGLAALPAALLGVYLHGLARDCTRETVHPAAFSAGLLAEALNEALLRLESLR